MMCNPQSSITRLCFRLNDGFLSCIRCILTKWDIYMGECLEFCDLNRNSRKSSNENFTAEKSKDESAYFFAIFMLNTRIYWKEKKILHWDSFNHKHIKQKDTRAKIYHDGIKEKEKQLWKTVVFRQLVFLTVESQESSLIELVSKYYIRTIYANKPFKSLKSC